MIQKQWLKPAAKRPGLEGIGWHAFRHNIAHFQTRLVRQWACSKRRAHEVLV
jgi:hypothetical protein